MFSFTISLIFSIFSAILYLFTLPFRYLITVAIDHPFIATFLFLIILMISITFLFIFKYLLIISYFRKLMKILSPIIGFLITFFFPQVNYVISVVILLFLPFKAIPNFLSQFIQCFYSIFSAKNWRKGFIKTKNGRNSLMTSERMLCCICFSNEKSVLFQPCNHICLCTECATKLITSTAPNCPICRARITSYIDVYI